MEEHLHCIWHVPGERGIAHVSSEEERGEAFIGGFLQGAEFRDVTLVEARPTDNGSLASIDMMSIGKTV
jgi:hypothetical protein